jgi:Na+-transporting methylmalonyl-CoA/oxaloacetate decarboxylase gamma subunit
MEHSFVAGLNTMANFGVTLVFLVLCYMGYTMWLEMEKERRRKEHEERVEEARRKLITKSLIASRMFLQKGGVGRAVDMLMTEGSLLELTDDEVHVINEGASYLWSQARHWLGRN